MCRNTLILIYEVHKVVSLTSNVYKERGIFLFVSVGNRKKGVLFVAFFFWKEQNYRYFYTFVCLTMCLI